MRIGKRIGATIIVVGFVCAVMGGPGSVAAQPSSSPGLIAEQIDECLGCHEGLDQSLVGTAHQISGVRKDGADPEGATCMSCHVGWRNHLEDPSRDNITTPREMTPAGQVTLCGRCHMTPHQVQMAGPDPHALANITCSDCHGIHGRLEIDAPSQERSQERSQKFSQMKGGPCARCHNSIIVEFHRRSSHPLEAGYLECTDCHELGMAGNTLTAIGFDWRCQECHAEHSGPFPFEHDVVNKHLVNGGGCIECHEPHGSGNDRLLKQPGNGLCNQCHGIPPGHQLAHSGLGVRLQCIDCHSEIHGSYEDSRFLDPQLGVKLFPDCFQSGCHSFGN
ncbi:MAG: hypothetical protein KJ970_09115 [Candidatus Eisenbacteria bacterium]|uniref:Doubled CXXCH motif domain-containing protein n=1 Tax=Eiseniibacteriota bacterium TaxID=2212470 RepID=A0A948RXV5_UNCEI|nr:hypothetical protein [Candidatus Eisenbacteria bacterium]MBU2691077.1 hypothetical protein [Candidatus Eisenbacteria bacterium]